MISALIVLRAVKARKGERPYTCEELATALDADANAVLSILADMKGRRLLSDHRRGDRREWQSWGQQ